ncbi:hypothetical protein BpHYR1_017438 [Brachionus plicatilis]|uniref:Uncharacterized protein n=1 Tax=Brachionus plicatilis TaxID=10195 RepID=A0A3M7R2Y7_BRAPC|nr:hypothetical protein BpHYR1_017438 [Brachionus plicatilis]
MIHKKHYPPLIFPHSKTIYLHLNQKNNKFKFDLGLAPFLLWFKSKCIIPREKLRSRLEGEVSSNTTSLNTNAVQIRLYLKDYFIILLLTKSSLFVSLFKT